ncbi:hypothetical protein H072_10134 [Dactylellina haptotyla CBS 200.50]|uniref:Uncharacterized protein n=1 Tax=Dactylellina haptotyla (strain CBS 200.50) TaxID=1284197 RepID=S8A0Y8_DACHA|nr:hypothetical protein H072_10134 [Dactylellina haptotyla CBS 200.50]
MASDSLFDIWQRNLSEFQVIAERLQHDPDRILTIDDEYVHLDNENYHELEHAYNLLKPLALTVSTFLSIPLSKVSKTYILQIIQAATLFLKEAERNVNNLQYATKGKRWISVYSYTSVFVSIAIVAYIIHTASIQSESMDWTIQDAIYHLDFALIKTGGWPITAEIHGFLTLLDTKILPLVDTSHVGLIDWESELIGYLQKRRVEQDLTSTFHGPEIVAPTITQWLNIYKRQTPIKLLEILEHWPVFDIPALESQAERGNDLIKSTENIKMSRWASTKYLISRTINGRRIVPVEIGRTYTDPDLQQKIMTFKDYVNKYLLPQDEEHASKDQDERVFGYLAQHNLLTQIPSLRNDICIPEYINYIRSASTEGEGFGLADDEEDPNQEVKTTINAWLGPANTVTPLHTDNYHNIFCQVVGRKYVRLYPPDAKDAMSPMGKDEKGVDMGNTSSVPVGWVENGNYSPRNGGAGDEEMPEEEEKEKWLRFKEAKYVDFVVHEGEAVFFPTRGRGYRKMCQQEPSHWNCNCLPVTSYSSQGRENPFKNADLPTPPSSPSARIRQLKNVFEAPAVKNDPPPPIREYSRGLRQRREAGSVGKLEDKCTECRIWGLPCDMKEPHCSNCLRKGNVCETAREWLGRVSGKNPVKNRSASVSAPPSPELVEVPVVETQIMTTIPEFSDNQAQLIEDISTAKEAYSMHHKATDESLADLKKNIRGLRAALTLLEIENNNDFTQEPEAISKPEPATVIDDFSYVTGLTQQEAPINSESINFGELTAAEVSSPFIKNESTPPPFLSTNDILVCPVPIETLNSPHSPTESTQQLSTLLPDVPSLVHDNQFMNSLNELNTTSRTVRSAAQTAYEKLKNVAQTEKTSTAFRHFVESLGSLDNILKIGSQTYEMLLDQQTPHSLIEIYCFLHFAYAMSQGDTDLMPISSDGEFHRDLLVFRSCLSSTPEYEGFQSQRDIFDEIAHHMADELECALRWAKRQNLTPTSFHGLSLEDILRLHSEGGNSCTDINSVTNGSVIQGSNIAGITLFGSASGITHDGTDALRNIQALQVFAGISRFLAGLNRFGSPFKIFSGEFCKSISSDIYKHPLYSKSFRHHHRLFDADELRDAIHMGVICKFDGKLIAHSSIHKILETSLEMLDVGSLITLEDYIEYARGLLMVVLLPLYVVHRFEDELVRRSQELVQQLPENLLRRVQWPECFNSQLSPVADFENQNNEYLANITYVAPEPTMSVILDSYYPSTLQQIPSSPPQCLQPEKMEYELSPTPESVHNNSGSNSPVISTPPTSYSEAGDSPKSNPTSPLQSLVCRTCRKTFTNKSNLARHERTKHSPGSAGSKKMLRCPIPGCKTMLGSARAKENMRTHLKKKHGIERPGMEEVRWRVDVLQGCV